MQMPEKNPGNKASFNPPALGGISLLIIFAVLSLTVFALLSLSTVQADIRLADASAQAVQDYYAADCEAQAILARLRQGERPIGVTVNDNLCSFRCVISDTQALEVEVLLQEDGGYTVLRWQAAPTGEWSFDDTLELWDGTMF